MKRTVFSLLGAVLAGGCARPEPAGLAPAGADESSVGALAVASPAVATREYTAFVAAPTAVAIPVAFDGATTVESAIGIIGWRTGYPVLVHWADLERAGLKRDAPLSIRSPSPDFADALHAIQESLPPVPDRSHLDWRLIDGILEIATVDYFDLLERELVFYEIAGLIDARRITGAWVNDDGLTVGLTAEECVKGITDSIQEHVETEGWVDQGGDAAAIRIFGTRLIVQAPRRYHAQILHLLSRFPGDPPATIVRVPASETQGLVAFEPVSPEPRIVLGDWMTIADAFDAVGRARNERVFIHWDCLAGDGLVPDAHPSLSAPAVTTSTALRLILETVQPTSTSYPTHPACRHWAGITEISSDRFFDSRERETWCYDVIGVLRSWWGPIAWEIPINKRSGPALEEQLRSVADILKECVETEGWIDNGGDTATMQGVDSRLIITAPRRYHAQIRAILSRLPGDPPYRVVPVPAGLVLEGDPDVPP